MTPDPTASAQRCTRCGREEYPGAYCTFCRTAEYDLIDHSHRTGKACPLGPYLDPLDQRPAERARLARDVAAWEAAGRPDAGGTILGTRRHPRHGSVEPQERREEAVSTPQARYDASPSIWEAAS